MMYRQEKIKMGKLWQVYPNTELTAELTPNVLFEGSRSACLAFLRQRKLMRNYKRGSIRLGKLIWEDLRD